MPRTVELYIKAKAGRRASGNAGDQGTVYNAILGNNGQHGLTAICPARDWGEWEGDAVTCPKCLKRLALD